MIMKPSRLIAIFLLTILLQNTFLYSTNSFDSSPSNHDVCIIEFEFYSDHLITDQLLQKQLSDCISDISPLKDKETFVQFILNHEVHYEGLQHLDKDSTKLSLLIKLTAFYAYNGFYDISYKTIDIFFSQQTDNLHELLLANQLAYITSYKTGRFEESIKHLRSLIQLASDQNEQELLVFALSHLSHVYYKLNELPKAKLFYSTLLSEAKKLDYQPLMLTALEILIGNHDHNQQIEGLFNPTSLYASSGNNRVSDVAFYLLTRYRTSHDEADKENVFRLIQEMASANNLNGLTIESGRLYLKDYIGNKPVETFTVFLEAASLLESESSSLLKKNNEVFNEINLYNTDTKKKYNTSPKMLFGSRLIFSIILIAALLFSVIIMLRIRKTRKKARQQQVEVIRSIEDLSAFLKTMDSDIDHRVTEYNQVMMDELKEREKVDVELKQALKRAEDANYLKNSFLSSMSHEIRTPLNGIMGFSNLLQQEMAELENTELYDYAHSIERSGERLLHLLNNIIDISRIEANDLPMNIKPVDLEQMINKVVEVFSFRANERGIRIVLDGKPEKPVLADKDTLMRVVMEVMDNSLKFTEKGFIKIECTSDLKNMVQHIVIKDTGIGIDESYIPHIFDAFRQESFGYTRQYQGAGLGMPLAQRMMLLMNGSINVSSVKSAGTTVTLSIPLSDQNKISLAVANQNEQPQLSLTESQQRRILVVEDDRSSRLIIGKMLKKYGIVEVVGDGDAALKTLASGKTADMIYNLVFLDINLPAPWDGIKLKDQIIKQYPEYEIIPFIAQTAYAMAGDKDRFIEAGFSNYIAKPIEMQQLEKLLSDLSFT